MSKKNETVEYDADEIEPLKLYYRDELLLNPKFSLDPDPLGELKMTKEEKTFTSLLVRYGFTNFDSLKNTIDMISKDMGITYDEAENLWHRTKVKDEYDRITMALRHRQYNQKQFSLSEIKSILTSMVIGKHTQYVGSLSEKGRIEALKLLTNIIQEEQKMLSNTSRLNSIDANVEEIKDLSITEIKALVAGIDENKAEEIKSKKSDIIAKMKLLNPSLRPNQIDFLYNLPIKELEDKLKHLEEIMNAPKTLVRVEPKKVEYKEGSFEWKVIQMAEKKKAERLEAERLKAEEERKKQKANETNVDESESAE